jgi:uncharacterized membrane protein
MSAIADAPIARPSRAVTPWSADMAPTRSHRWRLTRNCSLTPRQAVGAWSIPVVALLAVALFSAVQGWWWVALFALADIAALVLALWLYTRHALDGDTLLLDDDGMLRIEQQRGGRCQRIAWRASMVRLELVDGEPIRLWAGREQLQIGSEVTAPERPITAGENRRALPLADLNRSAPN